MMAFDEYQFLRYFIPGSLFSIYTSILIFSVLTPEVLYYFTFHPEFLIGIITGIVGSALPFGYLLYSFFDSTLYQKVTWNIKRRRIISDLDEVIENFKDIAKNEPARAKIFVDMLWIRFEDSDSSQKYSVVVRGTWSHLCARLTCCSIVPILSFISYFIFVRFIVAYANSLPSNLIFQPFTSENWFWGISVVVIILISICLCLGAKRPLKEGTTLESFFIKYIIEENPSEFKKLVEKSLSAKVTKSFEDKIKKDETDNIERRTYTLSGGVLLF
jgi:hypothetical protein